MPSPKWMACLVALLASAGLCADKKAQLPQAGQEFVFSPEAPEYMTCNIDFRDPTDKLWPNFVGGRGTGRLVYDVANPKGECTITFDRLNQKNGEQSRRVLGELIKPDQPFVVTLAVKSVGPFTEETITETDGKGKTKQRSALLSLLTGTLDVAGRKVPFETKAQVKVNPDNLYFELHWTLQGKDLGLKAEGATGPIEVFAGLTAFDLQSLPKKKGK
jgi:hypothetical protein